ncbi:MAG: DUF416 family protein [Candidatus Schekmanbacteria bacterium]|nr:DUF416 family protein [Candidatus Schekmanbacteria bacterium]
MVVLRFDETELIVQIDTLEPSLRVAFAAACAERLRPAYGCFSSITGRGNTTEFNVIIDRLWEDLDGQSMTIIEIKEKIDTCIELIPREDDGVWIPEQACAEDAAAALAYALRCRWNCQSQEAAWAARRAYEAMDHRVMTLEDIDPKVPGNEALLASHRLVQAELTRQSRDLHDLLGFTEADAPMAAAKLRERAKKEASTVFG